MIVRRSGLLVYSGTFGCTFTSSAAILSAESKPPNSEMQLVLLDCGLVIAGHFGILEESEHEIRSWLAQASLTDVLGLNRYQSILFNSLDMQMKCSVNFWLLLDILENKAYLLHLTWGFTRWCRRGPVDDGQGIGGRYTSRMQIKDLCRFGFAVVPCNEAFLTKTEEEVAWSSQDTKCGNLHDGNLSSSLVMRRIGSWGVFWYSWAKE